MVAMYPCVHDSDVSIVYEIESPDMVGHRA